MQIGRKVYYDIETGNKILETGEFKGVVKTSSIEQDIVKYKTLSELNRESFDVIELEYGKLSQDFIESQGDYHVEVLNLPFNNEETYSTNNNTIYRIVNNSLQYGLSDIVVKIDGEIITSGYVFDINKVIFDSPQTGRVTVRGIKKAELRFNYPDPNNPDSPVNYQRPLSEEIEELRVAQSITDSTLLELMEFVLL